eukprot:TRINITY_DN9003_c0_g1_i1.p1 TRINITY_DN9003_c0_g1~~TRINITY_DN9003_c0_g1_i1.p1  ORF type:complete len:330 (+),score=21.74 TRINITY_DN9003_c0_g1_i1:3-992(+)
MGMFPRALRFVVMLYFSSIVYTYISCPDSDVSWKIIALNPLNLASALLPYPWIRGIRKLRQSDSVESYGVTTEDRNVTSRDGFSIPIRIFRSSSLRGSSDPILVFIHGGGFCVGGIYEYAHEAAHFARSLNAIVISIGYRLAPEHPYPTPVYDSYDATKWIFDNAKSLGGDAMRISISGDSAGGCLTAIVNLMLLPSQYQVHQQVLIYPVVDLYRRSDGSMRRYENAYILPKWILDNYLKSYLTDPQLAQEFQASPLRYEGDVSKLPPTLVILANFDPLHDQGMEYAEKLRNAGVSVMIKEYDDVHGFFSIDVVNAKLARDDITAFYKV